MNYMAWIHGVDLRRFEAHEQDGPLLCSDAAGAKDDMALEKDVTVDHAPKAPSASPVRKSTP